MSDNLSDRAIGLITVPNLEYLLRTKSFYEFVADHLSYFTVDTITNCLKNNFKILEHSLINNENDILLIVKDIASKIEHKNKNINILDFKNDYVEVENLINELKIYQVVIKKKKNCCMGSWSQNSRPFGNINLQRY